MSSSRTPPPMLFAPGASGSGLSAYAPGRNDPPPPVDARLVEPETHTQMVDGVRIKTMGANPPHALAHTEVTHVFRGCLAPGFAAAVDMLSRLNATTDLAPDVSVFPAGLDPVTGGRQLEQITFEVCDSEDTAHVTDKARRFVGRGVRRVFYVHVGRRRVHEWDAAADLWRMLPGPAEIVDPCFAVPIPVAALVDRVLADDTVARALLAQKNPVLVEALGAERREGEFDTLGRQFARRLGRALTAAELNTLRARHTRLGGARLGDVVLDLDAAALTAWMGDPLAT